MTRPPAGRPREAATCAALVVLGLGTVLAFAFLGAAAAYLRAFGEPPPTRVNLIFWVPPDGDECLRQAVDLEDVPLVGTGVSLGDMCPHSQYGP